MGQNAAPSFWLKSMAVLMMVILSARMLALPTSMAESILGACS
jgi:hypothetical protein